MGVRRNKNKAILRHPSGATSLEKEADEIRKPSFKRGCHGRSAVTGDCFALHPTHARIITFKA